MTISIEEAKQIEGALHASVTRFQAAMRNRIEIL